ncbi:MAG TPA: hypothetical protein VKY89_03875 [Thermoanaerobaculia bacterium]|nr:hypothetical protein [Thermoanaerobaculia bacterium]
METRACGRILVVAVALAAAIALTSGAPSAVAQQGQSPTPIYMSPASPTEGEPFLVEADLVVPGGTAAGTVDLDGQQDIILEITTIITSPEPPGSLQHFEWSVPAVAAGAYTLEISSPFVGLVRQGIAVRPRTAQLGLVGKRFQVAVADQQAGASPAAVLLSDAGGYFTLFDPGNVELTVKLVDGRPVNGQWWVFIASMTNTGFTVSVTDTQGGTCIPFSTCPTRTYTNPPDTNQNFIDVAAF